MERGRPTVDPDHTTAVSLDRDQARAFLAAADTDLGPALCAPRPPRGSCCISGCAWTNSPPPTSPTSATTAVTGALNSRAIFEQAKGVLAQHGGLSMDAAFDRLRRHSRHHNQRLSAEALRIVDGDLDPDTLVSTTKRH